MAAQNGNFQAMRAAGFTKLAHQRKPLWKWSIILALVALWAGFGWLAAQGTDAPSDALYQTVGALTMSSGSFESVGDNPYRDVVRFAGFALTAIGLLFGFSGAVGRSVARFWMIGASGHVVIAGEGPAALALARSCRKAHDAVVLIARDLQPETAWSLRQSGIILIEGDPTHVDALRSARAQRAAHLVALSDDDTENLRVEAALRACTPQRRKPHLAAHVSIKAPLLLMEAREMRMLAQREYDGMDEAEKKKARPLSVDPRSFSVDEISARALLARHGVEILDLAEIQKREALHFVFFGFDAAAEAIAVRTLMSFWSVKFGAPRITVVTPGGDDTSRAFAARYPQAQAWDVWKADIAFVSFDWTRASLDGDFLDQVAAARGEPAAIVVSSGSDGQNIQLALALMRTANMRGVWAAPIFMKETMESEFSRQFASGDKTVEIDAYLQAFGAVEAVATRDYIVEGVLDRGAAIAQRLYEQNMAARDVDMRQLEAVGRNWNGVQETYRNANRAAVDSALVKLWDAGWRPATKDDRFGEVHPPIDEAMLARLSELEHARWVAERLLSGWRPGQRNNKLMMHNNIVGWDALTAEEQGRDTDQVRAAAKVARALFPRGFVRR